MQKKISDRNLDNKKRKMDLLIQEFKCDLINLINSWQEYFQNCDTESDQYYPFVQEEKR